MCGIAGGCWAEPPEDLDRRLNQAMTRLQHRGPNDQGKLMVRSQDYSVALCQTRLAIIDLGSSWHQPMQTEDKNYTIIFNGEIYNYIELKKELITIGHSFYSASDTEVLLAAWAEWGAACLPRLEGMFSFVVLDHRKKKLTCVRYAFGIKPLFYEQNKNEVVFASEIQALLALRRGRPHLDLQRAYDYLVYGDYDSCERSFFRDICHLPPGTFLEIDLFTSTRCKPVVWWKPKTTETCQLSFKQAADSVREQFLYNVRLHLRSDVPLGAALSGGIDSSAVVCAIRHLEPEIPIHTFSYIAKDTKISEEKWVDIVNKRCGATSHKVITTGEDLLRDLDRIIFAQGEPFGSTSIYAQYRVFQMAKENGVTVTLDGQGADELLAGYNGFAGQRMLSLFERGQLTELCGFARKWGRWPGRSFLGAWLRFAKVLAPSDWSGQIFGHSQNDIRPSCLNLRLLENAGVILREDRLGLKNENRGRRVIEALSNSLQIRGLPQLLRHGDRNSMAFAIESRVPFLTIPMASLLFSMPEKYLISENGETKHVFREAMRGIVPDEILQRKDKIGFTTAESTWLIKISPHLRQWIRESSDISLFNIPKMLMQFDQVIEGRRAFSWEIWRWVNFCRWHQITGISSD